MNWFTKLANWYLFTFCKKRIIIDLMRPFVEVTLMRSSIEAHMKRNDLPNEDYLKLKAVTQSYMQIERRIQDAVNFILTTKKTPNLRKFFFDLATDINNIKVPTI